MLKLPTLDVARLEEIVKIAKEMEHSQVFRSRIETTGQSDIHQSLILELLSYSFLEPELRWQSGTKLDTDQQTMYLWSKQSNAWFPSKVQVHPDRESQFKK
jgi:hypothetical protein